MKAKPFFKGCLSLFLLACGAMQTMGTEFTREDMQNIRVKWDIHPMYAHVNENVRVVGDIYITSDAYTLEKKEFSIVGPYVYIDFTFSRGDFAPGKEVLIHEPYQIEIGTLKEGDYVFIGQVNGMMIFEQKYKVSTQHPENPNPTPTPIQVPFYKAKIDFEDRIFTVEEDVVMNVYGYLPDTAHTITRAEASVNGPEVKIDVTIESSGVGAQVLVPTEQTFNLGKMPVGEYYVVLFINGEPVEKSKFMVVVTVEPKPTPIPNPYDAKIVVDPINPAVNEKFMILMEGLWPMTGYEIVSKEVTIQGRDITVMMNVKEPEVGATVMTPFRELLAEPSLGYGIYTIWVKMNDQKLEPVSFWVGQVWRSDMKENVLIDYRRETMTGEDPCLLNIDSTRNMMGVNAESHQNAIVNNVIPESVWNDLKAALDAADFANLPPSLPSPNSSNHVVYVITYQSKMVTVEEGAQISEPLANALAILNELADQIMETSQSAVSSWEMY